MKKKEEKKNKNKITMLNFSQRWQREGIIQVKRKGESKVEGENKKKND